MIKEDADYLLSQKALEEVWGNEDDSYWESLLWLSMEQGEIILVRYPFTDPVDYKIRPAIIVSNNLFNKKFHPLVCPITTKPHPENIQINNKLEDGGLDRESYVRPTVIVTIHPELILKKIGKAKNEVLEEIKKVLVKNF